MSAGYTYPSGSARRGSHPRGLHPLERLDGADSWSPRIREGGFRETEDVGYLLKPRVNGGVCGAGTASQAGQPTFRPYIWRDPARTHRWEALPAPGSEASTAVKS